MRAGSRLQFYRFAYGFVGDGRAAGPPPCELAAGLFRGLADRLRYGDEVRALPLVQQQLACNLLVIGAEALGRGGIIAVKAVDLRHCGSRPLARMLSMAPEQSAALTLMTPVVDLSCLALCTAYFTGLLARVQGWRRRRGKLRRAGFT